MATPEDIQANAEFVRLADTFVEVPGGKNFNNHANVTVISQVAKEQGVDAVWPGWDMPVRIQSFHMNYQSLGSSLLVPPRL
jgi:acetyl-CoA carboxylase/biotin carboxylase 1